MKPSETGGELNAKADNVTQETSAAVILTVGIKTEENVVPATTMPQAATLAKKTSAAVTPPVPIKIEENVAPTVTKPSAAIPSKKRKIEDCDSGETQSTIGLSEESSASNESVNHSMEGNDECANVNATLAKRIQKPEALTIILRDQVGEQTFFRIKEVASMGKMFEMYAKRKDVCAQALSFLLDGQRISFAETPRSLGLHDGDQIDVLLIQNGGKPVILLYPLNQLVVTVNLQLSFEWSFSALYPKPLTKGSPGLDMVSTSHVQRGESKSGGNKCMWRVRASPDGSLLDLKTGKEYPYLFWEAHSKDGRVSQKFKLEETPSFCVAGGKAGDFLDDALTRLGLNMRERCDMITYWLPQLEAYPFNVIHFVDVQRYEQTAKLDIFPAPDLVIRVFMAFRGVTTYEAEGDSAKLNYLQAPAREGFVAVEGGGMNLNGRVHN